MPQSAEKILHCPECQEVLLWCREQNFWQCPRCEGEWWPDAARLAEVEQAKQTASKREAVKKKLLTSKYYFFDHSPKEVLPAGPPKGGRSSSGNRRKKKKPKKIQKPYFEI